MNDSTLKRIIQILMVIAGTLAAVTAFTGLLPKAVIAYVGISVAVLTTLAQQLEKHLMPRSGKASAEVAKKLSLLICLGALSLSLSACGGGLTEGYRAVYVTERAGEAASKAIGESIRLRRAYCREKHTGVAGYQACLSDYVKAGEKWVKYVKPAINTSLKATFEGLEQARKKGSEAKWEERLKSGFCALVEAVGDWEHLMGDKAKEALAWVKLAEGIVCEK